MQTPDTNIPDQPEAARRVGQAEQTQRSIALRHEVDIECAQRPEIIPKAEGALMRGMECLGFVASLPHISVVFEPSPEGINLGRTRVKGDGMVEVVFDASLSTPEGEAAAVERLRQEGKEYPGVAGALTHELAHIAEWGVSGMPRQPATRLLDEGWARLVEDAGATEDSATLVRQAKEQVVRGLREEPARYGRCLEFTRPVIREESASLNAAEYETGKALLLWVRERWGNASMVKLLQLGISPSRRNDDTGTFEPAMVDREIHGEEAARDYGRLTSNIEKLSSDDLYARACAWEGRQFERALLRVTGMQSIGQVQGEFRKWLAAPNPHS